MQELFTLSQHLYIAGKLSILVNGLKQDVESQLKFWEHILLEVLLRADLIKRGRVWHDLGHVYGGELGCLHDVHGFTMLEDIDCLAGALHIQRLDVSFHHYFKFLTFSSWYNNLIV